MTFRFLTYNPHWNTKVKEKSGKMICELDENAGRIYQREILMWSEVLSNPGGPEQHPIFLTEQNIYIF